MNVVTSGSRLVLTVTGGLLGGLTAALLSISPQVSAGRSPVIELSIGLLARRNNVAAPSCSPRDNAPRIQATTAVDEGRSSLSFDNNDLWSAIRSGDGGSPSVNRAGRCGAGSITCLCITARISWAMNGGSPVNSSWRMQPSE